MLFGKLTDATATKQKKNTLKILHVDTNLTSGMNSEMYMTVHNQSSVCVLLTLVSLGGNYFMQLLMLTSTNVSAIYFKVHIFKQQILFHYEAIAG
jgi:hypothetical protein